MATPRRLSLSAVLAGLSLGGACALFDGSCGESRVVNVYARPDGSPIAGASQTEQLSRIALAENRGRAVIAGFERWMDWLVVAPGVSGTVTAVHLHEGLPGPVEGRLLYDLPPGGAQPAIGVVISGNETEHTTAVGPWYRGTVPFRELQLILYRSPTYLDIHTASGVVFQAPLGNPPFIAEPEDPRRWNTYSCS